jgi:hypothetical protein
MNYQKAVIKELRKVFGDPLPMFVATNPYGGGASYYDKDDVLRNSGLFGFDSQEEFDEFLKSNRHCYCLKEGDNIY